MIGILALAWLLVQAVYPPSLIVQYPLPVGEHPRCVWSGPFWYASISSDPACGTNVPIPELSPIAWSYEFAPGVYLWRPGVADHRSPPSPICDWLLHKDTSWWGQELFRVPNDPELIGVEMVRVGWAVSEEGYALNSQPVRMMIVAPP